MSAFVASLLDKIETRRARAGVVGLGYVGLPLAVELAKAGFRTTGIDLDERKIQAINDGRVVHPRCAGGRGPALRKAASSMRPPTSRSSSELDTINICVPTPLRKTKDPDMSYIVSAVESIAEHLHPGMLIVPRIDDLSRHDRRGRAAAARGDRAQGRQGLLPRVLARAGRSGQPDVPARATCRRSSAASRRTASSSPTALYATGHRHGRPGRARRASRRW